jgi:hypothetical protein
MTVKFVDPVTPLRVAETVAVPGPALTARPVVFTEKIFELVELQSAELVKLCVL